MPTKPTQSSAPAKLTLVGRCFHIFGDDGSVQNQGVVRGDLGEGRYLVQFFEWMLGELSTMEIRHIGDMRGGREAGCWQFYEDAEHMNFWYEYRYSHPTKLARRDDAAE